MLNDSLSYVTKLGKTDAMKYIQWSVFFLHEFISLARFNWDYDTTNKDYTHLNSCVGCACSSIRDANHVNRLGWVYFGRMVADEVISIVPELSPFITKNETLSAALAAGTL